MKYIKAKVRYLNAMQDGFITSTFYVNAYSFTEAEQKLVKHVGEDEYEIKSMGWVEFGETHIKCDGEDFFKVTLQSSVVNEITGKVKKSKYTMLYEGKDATEVSCVVEKSMYNTDEILRVEKLDVSMIIN